MTGKAGQGGEYEGADAPPLLGVLMLDSRFPRIKGDIGHPGSFPFPVRYRVVPGAAPARVVLGDAEPLFEAFAEAAQGLVAEGALGLTTSCGFLAPFQRRLAARAGVPVAASALAQLPLLQATLPPSMRVGVLTASAEALTPAFLAAAGAPAETPMAGMPPGGAFAEAVLGDRPTLDVDAVRAEAVAAAQALAARGDVGAILLECTNLPPYADAIRAATGLPVWSILDLLIWFHAGLARRTGARP